MRRQTAWQRKLSSPAPHQRHQWNGNQAASVSTCHTKNIALDTSRFHARREFAVILHRLRSGHNRLNQWAHKIDPWQDETCRHGCPAPENSAHVLLACPAYENHRSKLKKFTDVKGIPWNLPALLGLDRTVPAQLRKNTTNRVAVFVRQTGLLNLI